MIKFIFKLIFGDYNQRIGKSMSAFTKIIEKCKKLNEEMQEDIRKRLRSKTKKALTKVGALLNAFAEVVENVVDDNLDFD